MEAASKPNVLILLTTYNGVIWIEDQIKSILSQSRVNVKILVSDDFSNDESPKLLGDIIKNNPNIKKLDNSIKCGTAGQNFFQLIRNCDYKNFDYIAFSDQDDIWLENKLFNGIKCLEQSSACGYSSSALAFWDSGKEKLLTQNQSVRNLDYLFEGAGQGCTFIMKSDLFSLVQKFCKNNKSLTDSFYYHDWLVYLIARTNRKKWFFDNRSFIKYRQHTGNETGAKGSFTAIKSRLRLIANGWYKGQIEVALEIARLTINKSSDLEKFENIFTTKKSIFRRLNLARFFIFHGRRKFADRLVLVLSSLLGWI